MTPLSRRTFIKATSILGGGLFLGVDLFCKKITNENTPSPDGSFQPNVWIKIDKTGAVTIMFAKVEMGQGNKTALTMLIAEELDADLATIKVEQALTDPKKYGNQSTGGSTSIRTQYLTMRKAGASAREMLLAAAAKQWNTDTASCKAENGFIIHTSSGKKLSYGELASEAGKLTPPQMPTLKDPKDFRYLRKKMRRVDTPSKVDGSAIFGMDISIPGMVYATIVRPNAFGAKVQSYDASKAKTIHGFKDVVQTDEFLIAVATSTWGAFQVKEALSVTWTEGTFAGQSSERLWKQFEETAKSEGETTKSEGDALQTYNDSKRKIEAVYHTPFAAHVTMEPMNCTVQLTKGKCEIWAPSQTPQDAQSEAANVLGISVDDVTLHVTLLGGGFGRRLETDFVVDAVKVAKAINLPVKVVWTREDDMQHDFYRPAQYSILRAGLDANNAPLVWLHRIVGPEGKGLLTHASSPPYDFSDLKIETTALETGIPTGAWRSVGASQNGFVIESFVDELAYVTGKDPYEFRRTLLKGSKRLKRALELAAEKSGWGTPMPKGKGRGIACVSAFGSHVAEVAEVTVSDNGSFTVDRVVVAVDCGPYVNPDGIDAQMNSSIAFGLSAAIKDEITIENGGVKQSNFDDYRMLMIDEMPKVEVHIVESDDDIGGIGEPGVPPIAPAVCNAIFAATGKRIRSLPIKI